MPLTSHYKKAARFLLHTAGALHGVRQWYGDRFRILMYHKFPDGPEARDLLWRQCLHMKRHYRVVSLTEIGRALRERRPLPRNALAVTVDDGFRDFLLNGHPVFHAHGIPTLVYLVTGFMDGALWFWWDQIAHAVRQTPLRSLQLSLSAGLPRERFALESDEDRRIATDAIVAAIKTLDSDESRQQARLALWKALKVDVPENPPPEVSPLSWSDARILADNGVEFGAHSVTHTTLSRIQNARTLKDEIFESKRRIEQELGREVLHFCYPFGRPTDFNDESVRTVDGCGFLTSTTALLGLNDMRSDPLRLARLGVDSTMPLHYYKEMLAGVHFA